jgi:acetolactate synthase-1/2/3 large subunit
MVKQWQDLFYEQRYSGTVMRNPDFVRLAESMDCTGLRIRDSQELRDGIREFLFADHSNNGSGGRPVVLDCVVEAAEHVYPMVPAGKGLHEMVLGIDERMEL